MYYHRVYILKEINGTATNLHGNYERWKECCPSDAAICNFFLMISMLE